MLPRPVIHFAHDGTDLPEVAMSVPLEWFWDRGGPHTFFSVLACAAFLSAGYLLYFRRDSQSAAEATLVAWQLALCDVIWAIVESFELLGGPPPPWEMQLRQYEAAIGRLILPVVLTVPIAWRMLAKSSAFPIYKIRLFVLATMLAALDILVYLFWFVPALWF